MPRLSRIQLNEVYGAPLRILGKDVGLFPIIIVLITISFGLALAAIISFICSKWLAVVSIGSLSIGASRLFLFSTFGRQEKAFRSPVRLLNTFFTGFIVADLARHEDGVILTLLRLIAIEIGIPDKCGMVAILMICEIIAGFFGFYYFKLLLLNPLHQLHESMTGELARLDIFSKVDISKYVRVESGGKLAEDLPEVYRHMAKDVITARGSWSKIESSDNLISRARSFYLAEDYAQAEPLYKQYLRSHPKHRGAIHELVGIEIALNRPMDGLDVLDQVLKGPSLPKGTTELVNLYDTILKQADLPKAELDGRLFDLLRSLEKNRERKDPYFRIAILKLYSHLTLEQMAESESGILSHVNALARFVDTDDSITQDLDSVLQRPNLQRFRMNVH